MPKLCAVAFLVSCALPWNATAQTVTLNGAAAVRSAEDFATKTFQDPWDMNEVTDVGGFATSADQPASGLSNVSFAGGLFTATNANGQPNFFLLESGNPFAARIGKIGTNYPIDASTYRLLAFRMTAPSPNTGQVIWYAGNMYQTSPNVLGYITASAGNGTYFVNLSTLPVRSGSAWSGTVGTLRFDLFGGSIGETLAFDWFRLVNIDASLCRQVTWTRGGQVDLYLDTDGTTNGNESLLVANVSNGSGTASAGCSAGATGHTFYAGALAPGSYQMLVRATGTNNAFDRSAASYMVNAIPTVSITAPSEEGSSSEFAPAILGNAWDMDSTADVDYYANVSGQTITTIGAESEAGPSLGSVRVLQATSLPASAGSVGDPWLGLLWMGTRGRINRIDPDKYRIFTVEFGVPNKARDIAQGSIARIVWRVAGEPLMTVSDDIIFNSRAGANVMNKIVVDMADRAALPIEPGSSTAGWVPGTSANPGLDVFRFDPHEYSPATAFFVRRAKLAALERLAPSATYQVTFVKSEPGATASVYYDSDRNPGNGRTLIGTTSGSAVTWTTPNPAGATSYYIYVELSDGQNTNGAYAKWPVVVDPNMQPRQSLTLDRSSLNFGVSYAGGPYITPPQVVWMSASGSGPTPCWEVDTALSPGAGQYLSITPASGTGAGSFTVSIAGAPPVGTMSGSLRVKSCTSAVGFENSPRILPFTINAGGGSGNPFGSFDTPVIGAVDVSGSVPVTGWALDDVAVSGVKIYRDAVPETEGGGLVFIGDAVLVSGARPDLEAAYPDLPLNYRGGWGYLLLSNMLPDRFARTPAGGNGQFTLHAFARDVEGHSVLVGSRTISLNNQGATRPFGAIDTPAQGEVVSGTINNFGWALTQAPKTIPANGSTIQVVVDGIGLGHPSALVSRSDIVSLFSGRGYNDIDHHIGVFSLNTTALSNGVHTIAWGVVDSAGNADGIGSRYFTVQNGPGLRAGLGGALRMEGSATIGVQADALTFQVDPRSLPESDAAVWVRRGLEESAGEERIDGSSRIIRLPELERLQLRLDDGAPIDAIYEGYSKVGARLERLPIGSTLDGGAFSWLPGLAFTGRYELLFTRTSSAGAEQLPVTVVYEPKHRAAVPSDIQVMIDAPVSGTVTLPFAVMGWALDRHATTGTGVDVVDVWAYPVVGGRYGSPLFLGSARYGDARPDVGAYFGMPFTWSAFGLEVAALPAGTYDVAVFARSAATQVFAPARLVRITVR